MIWEVSTAVLVKPIKKHCVKWTYMTLVHNCSLYVVKTLFLKWEFHWELIYLSIKELLFFRI